MRKEIRLRHSCQPRTHHHIRAIFPLAIWVLDLRLRDTSRIVPLVARSLTTDGNKNQPEPQEIQQSAVLNVKARRENGVMLAMDLVKQR